MHVVVVGGGVSGLGSAVALARAGHEVTVIERDDTPMPASADAAFEWDRRGAPQVRHSHAFLARLRNILLDRYPDIHSALLAQGATEMRFGDDLPPTIHDFAAEPGDDELVMIASRRTTFEWVLRRAALAEGRVEIRTGDGVCGLVTAAATSDVDAPDGPPRVSGVRLDSGAEVVGDLVVVAGGRRSSLPDWLADIGCGPVGEEVEDTGIVYFSRFYRLHDGHQAPPRDGRPIGADLGYLKYGVFVGDNRTVSVTLAISNQDDELRRLLADPAVFEACGRQLAATAPWLDGRCEPLHDGVHVMAGLLNRWREYVVDGQPLALGVLPVGDAVLCTNPLYGRGCSTGFWGAQLLADAITGWEQQLAGAPSAVDLTALAVEHDAALREHLLPWYRSSVAQDAEARRVAAKILAGEDPDSDQTDSEAFMRAVLRDGLLPALRVDSVVLRAFFRTLNLLTHPDAMLHDHAVMNRVLMVWQDRDNRPPEPVLGPRRRRDMLALLAA